MRMRVLLPLWCLGLQAQTIFDIRPETITHCNSAGLGKARIVWDSPGASLVRVHVHSPSGPAMTGLEPPAGSAETGEWVRDGTRFVLADEAGRELASVTARVRCFLPDTALTDALASADYFPLEVGNQWVYRVNDRAITAGYLTRRVVRAEAAGGKVWYLVADTVGGRPQPGTVETRYRPDAAGRIFRIAPNGGEELWLDPTPSPDASARLTVEQRGAPFTTALGTFRDSLAYTARAPLLLERGVFVRGIGLVSSESTMLTGSSGGFFESLELVYASLAGGNLVFSKHATGLDLAAESTDLNVSGRAVTNCAVPCYFAACGFAPGADPPATYKPCFQARLRVDSPGPAAAIVLTLTDSAGTSVFTEDETIPADLSEAIVFRQVPLYTAPNQPLAPGAYTLRARLTAAGGTETASAAVAVRVR